jgi:hypothetical protein
MELLGHHLHINSSKSFSDAMHLQAPEELLSFWASLRQKSNTALIGFFGAAACDSQQMPWSNQMDKSPRAHVYH